MNKIQDYNAVEDELYNIRRDQIRGNQSNKGKPVYTHPYITQCLKKNIHTEANQ